MAQLSRELAELDATYGRLESECQNMRDELAELGINTAKKSIGGLPDSPELSNQVALVNKLARNSQERSRFFRDLGLHGQMDDGDIVSFLSGVLRSPKGKEMIVSIMTRCHNILED